MMPRTGTTPCIQEPSILLRHGDFARGTIAKIFLKACLIAACALAIPYGTAFAQSVPSASPKRMADWLIKPCRDATEADRSSPRIADMERGGLNTIACLEEVVLDLTEQLFYDDVLSRTEMRARLDKLSAIYQEIYFDLENRNKSCFCGLFHSFSGHSAYWDLLENMILDMVTVRDSPSYFSRRAGKPK